MRLFLGGSFSRRIELESNNYYITGKRAVDIRWARGCRCRILSTHTTLPMHPTPNWFTAVNLGRGFADATGVTQMTGGSLSYINAKAERHRLD